MYKKNSLILSAVLLAGCLPESGIESGIKTSNDALTSVGASIVHTDIEMAKTSVDSIHLDTVAPKAVKLAYRPNISQQFNGIDMVSLRLASVLEEIPYSVDELPVYAQMVNQSQWLGEQMSEDVVMRIQALLNWHHHSVGVLDGKFNKNTIKAMQVFQQARGITATDKMDHATWQALSSNPTLMSQPVLVNYTLSADDVRLHKGRSQYKNIIEKLAEKFHMSQTLFKSLNEGISIKAGNIITVYNPYQPNQASVSRVVIHKKHNLLYAYDSSNKLVASYPTTVNLTRTPKGKYKVANRIIDPHYNSDFSNKKNTIPPGPNSPVGRVWIGISKPSFGIHGSPDPEKISQQTSAGCVRLTNWDALELFGAIEEGAQVEFL